jgi:hypothetical protein
MRRANPGRGAALRAGGNPVGRPAGSARAAPAGMVKVTPAGGTRGGGAVGRGLSRAQWGSPAQPFRHIGAGAGGGEGESADHRVGVAAGAGEGASHMPPTTVTRMYSADSTCPDQ